MKKCYRNNQMPEGARASESAIMFGCDACEYMHNNELVTCSKFIGLSGKDPQSEDVYKDTYRCVDSWMSILMIENSKQGMSTTVAVENARNSINESVGKVTDAISTVNTNLKSTSEAMLNAQVMHRLETNAHEMPQKEVKAVSGGMYDEGKTHQVSSDIYGG